MGAVKIWRDTDGLWHWHTGEGVMSTPPHVKRPEQAAQWLGQKVEVVRDRFGAPATTRSSGKKRKHLPPLQQYTIDGEFVREWRSVIQAVRETGISERAIYKNMRGSTPHAGGFVWKRGGM